MAESYILSFREAYFKKNRVNQPFTNLFLNQPLTNFLLNQTAQHKSWKLRIFCLKGD